MSQFDLSTPIPFETYADLVATSGWPDGQLAVVQDADDVVYMWSSFFAEATGQGWLELATTLRATRWHSGSGPPAASLGNANDYYIDELTENVYRKDPVPIVPELKLDDLGSASAGTFSAAKAMTPTANALNLVAVILRDSSTGAPVATSLSGCGMNWDLVTHVEPSAEFTVALFRGMESSGLSAGTLTGTYTGTAVTCLIQCVEFSGGIVTGGTHGDTAIVQSNIAADASGAAAALAVSLAAFTDPVHNPTFACFGVDSHTSGTGGPSAEAGYSSRGRSYGNVAHLLSEWLLAADSSPSFSLATGSGLIGGIAVEIAANAADQWTLVGMIPATVAAAPTFGDGSDGAAAFDGVNAVAGASRAGTTYTLTRDVFYTDATVSSGVTIIASGWRIFCSGTLTNAGTIHNNGGDASGTTGGTAAPGGLYGGGTAGAAGLASGTATSNGTGATNTNNTGWHNLGSAGGTGGGGGAGGAGGLTRVRAPLPGYRDLISVIAATAITPSTIDASASNVPVTYNLCGGTGGGSGRRLTGGTATASGAGGGGAGVVVICAKTIDNSAGIIRANGGNGSNATGGTCATGGGAGGGGGLLLLAYSTLTAGTEQANGGIHGNSINGDTPAATDGTAGRLIKVPV